MKNNVIFSGYDFSAFLDYDISNDLYLYEIGTYVCPPLYSYGPVIRARGIFHYVFSGCGRLVLEDKEYHIGAKQGFYIPPNQKAFYEADKDDPWSYGWLHIGGPRLFELLYKIGINEEQPIFTPIEQSDQFEKIFFDIKENKEREIYCIGKLYELLDYMTENSQNKTVKKANIHLEYVKKVIKYIQLKYSEQITITEIAAACGLNRSYLSRLFKDATGISIKDYLISYRMKTAIKLLESNTLSIQDISFHVGYSDIFTFSKAFKKYTGKSPSHWKK